VEYVNESKTQNVINPKNAGVYKNTCHNESLNGKQENGVASYIP
jgi:hypothetical protein